MIKTRFSAGSDNGNNPILAPLMASLSLILIAFYILFYSMTAIDESKRAAAVGSLQGSFGGIDGGFNSQEPVSPEARLLDASLLEERSSDLRAKIDSFLHRRALRSGAVDVFAEDQGIMINLPHALLFHEQSDRLSETGTALLLKIAEFLRGLTQVRFELYDFTAPGGGSAEVSRQLSLAALRAGRVYNLMTIQGGWPAARVLAFGRVAPVAGESAGSLPGDTLRIRVIGGVPAYGMDGRPAKLRVGDFTF
ncbi:MAG TPA: hypothetical protein ENN66_04270 [Proteobacteria bacterium]|nr:hypothetical protein [Pseudomonadota bacterium]